MPLIEPVLWVAGAAAVVNVVCRTAIVLLAMRRMRSIRDLPAVTELARALLGRSSKPASQDKPSTQ